MDIKIDVSKIIIETDRLILRAWQESDLSDFFEYASVDGVGEMAGWNHHQNIDVSRDILSSFISEKEIFAIELKSNKKVIGSLGLHYSWANDDENYKDLMVRDIGYVLSKDYWGLGLMPEAVSEVIKYCFNSLNLDALTCLHSDINNQSRRVIEKSGFKFVRESRFYDKQLQKSFSDRKYILMSNFAK